MPSSYTNLGIQKMATGEKAGTWGTLTNTNWDMIENIAGGYTTQALSDGGTVTLTKNNGSSSVLSTRIIKLTGTLSSGNAIVTVPDSIEAWWIVYNAEGGSTYTVTFKTVSGTGVAWAAGETGYKLLYTDGTNVIDTGFLSNVVDDTSPQLGGNLDVNSNSIVSASNGNIPLAPNGTGEIVLGSGSADADLTTSGAYDLIIDTNTGTNAGNITLSNGANGDITFTNNGTGKVKFNDAAYFPEATLTFDATQDWDVQASPVAKVVLTANVIFDAPDNPTTGQFISILCIQDAGGSNTIGWNAVFQFASATAPTATTTGDQGDLFCFRYNGTKWLEVGTTLNLTVA